MYSQLIWMMLSMTKTNEFLQTELKASLNYFSLTFLKSYHQIVDKDENLFFSSISLATTISVLISGSDGTTHEQLVELMGIGNLVYNFTLEVAAKKVKDDFKMHDFANDHLFFRMLNRIYFKKDTKLQEDFTMIAKDAYDVDLLETDFQADSEELLEKINKWVETESRNKIKNVFKQIDPETVMLIINLVYFKGKWSKPFPMGNVRQKQFTNLNGEKKKVDTMYETDYYPFGQFHKYRILQLDYMSNCSMYIVLPNENVNLNDLLIDLNPDELNDDLKRLKSTHLDIQIPKFNLKSQINLKDVLQKAGVTTLFTEQANLGRMSSDRNLMVSEASHNAFISVDEDGTEASAVTSFKLMPRSMFMGTEFHVDRPFIFIIRLNGVNIFVGALKNF